MVQMSEMICIAPEFADCFKKIGLESIDDIFKFAGGVIATGYLPIF
jgi:hypothetical protein